MGRASGFGGGDGQGHACNARTIRRTARGTIGPPREFASSGVRASSMDVRWRATERSPVTRQGRAGPAARRPVDPPPNRPTGPAGPPPRSRPAARARGAVPREPPSGTTMRWWRSGAHIRARWRLVRSGRRTPEPLGGSGVAVGRAGPRRPGAWQGRGGSGGPAGGRAHGKGAVSRAGPRRPGAWQGRSGSAGPRRPGAWQGRVARSSSRRPCRHAAGRAQHRTPRRARHRTPRRWRPECPGGGIGGLPVRSLRCPRDPASSSPSPRSPWSSPPAAAPGHRS
jgi:hypothetical protein